MFLLYLWLLPLILHYGELYNNFMIYHNVIIETKGTMNVMHLNHPETIPRLVRGKLSSTKLIPGAKEIGDTRLYDLGKVIALSLSRSFTVCKMQKQ